MKFLYTLQLFSFKHIYRGKQGTNLRRYLQIKKKQQELFVHSFFLYESHLKYKYFNLHCASEYLCHFPLTDIISLKRVMSIAINTSVKRDIWKRCHLTIMQLMLLRRVLKCYVIAFILYVRKF